jgi:hypothetical protein
MHRKLVWVECLRRWIAKMWRDQSISHSNASALYTLSHFSTSTWLDESLLCTQITARWSGCSRHSVPVCIYAGYCDCKLTTFRLSIVQERRWWCHALSRNQMSLNTVEPYEEVEPLYCILGTFSCQVVFHCICSPCLPRLTHSLSPVLSAQTSAHARSPSRKWRNLLTVDATSIFYEKQLCLTTCMSVEQTRPIHLEVGHHLGFGPIMPMESTLMHYSY